ncbi:MAG: MvaI/BcnI family restriction endonuclease [Colwellia sp.]|nr:MvaI/BcnI family restriction endonuclease [Colwellia sp.]
MIKKNIIDASIPIRRVFLDSGVFNYDTATDGDIYHTTTLVLSDDSVIEKKTSFYRPEAKPGKAGDPRFWPSVFHKYANEDDLIYVTSIDDKVLLIPVIESCVNEENLKLHFESSKLDDALSTLIDKIKALSGTPIKSCSPERKNNKDIGDTLEIALGLKINNSAGADYLGEVEIKSKGSKMKTADTLFCKVPDKKLSPFSTVNEVINEFGYQSTKESLANYKSLFVTVGTSPNPQGLFNIVDYDNEHLVQIHTDGDKQQIVCKWSFETLKKSLFTKHPKTVWVKASDQIISGEIHFTYEPNFEVTMKPIFSQFLSLIEQDLIVFDWRGAIPLIKGNKLIDYGHAFRLKNPSDRKVLFESHSIS